MKALRVLSLGLLILLGLVHFDWFLRRANPNL
jgi:hypothetical protein